MNCRDFEEAMAAALAGDPAPEEATSHLGQCRACQTRARQMLQLHESLFRTLEPFPPPLGDAMQTVLRQMDQDLRSPESSLVAAARERIEKLPKPAPPSVFGRVRRRMVLAAAGVLLMIAAVASYLTWRSPGERVGAPRPEAGREPGEIRKDALEEARKEDALRREKDEEFARWREERATLEKKRQELTAFPKGTEEKALREADLAKRKLDEEAARQKTLEEARERKDAKPPVDPAPERRTPVDLTVVKVGRLDKTKGTVYVVSPASAQSAQKVRVQDGRDLVSGESILTEGPGSHALIAGVDSSKLELGANSSLVLGGSANDVSLPRGSLSVQVSKNPLSLSTAHARIQMTTGQFYLHARTDMTYFETRQGAAQFTNLTTGVSQHVQVGQFAVSPVFPGIDQKRIDRAIQDGIDCLKKAGSPPAAPGAIPNSDPLILLTFVHAGVPESDPRFQELLRDILKNPIERTYVAALQAMILEELDRVKYQARIVDCAQFLVDNQCRNGEWTYGTPSPGGSRPFVDPRPDVASGEKLDASGRRVKPKIVKKVVVQKMREGPAQGDNSNAQYAALGLRACFDAGVLVPAETVQLAVKWWRESQFADKDDRKAAYGGKGWCYHDGKGTVNGSDCCKYTYAGMTAGAVGSLAIYDFMLGRDWKSDAGIRLGLDWLTFNFSVTRNFKWGKEIPGDPEDLGGHFYYLYALERMGMFTGHERLGKHEWYPEGAAVILERQRPDGSWLDVPLGNEAVWDTCFSILFLRRATRPLGDVASVDRFNKR